MSIPEIIGGVIVLVVCLAIIVLTISQQTKGQGLSGAIMGANSGMAGGRMRQEDIMLSKLTKYTAVVLFVVTIVACALSTRLG